jgi:hypothetical protein
LYFVILIPPVLWYDRGMEQVLEKLYFGVFEFVLTPEKTIIFPPFKGNVFRGALGKALKDLTCAFKSKQCNECLIRDKCLYAQIFESHNVEGKSILKNIEKAPHPFVIFVPDKYRLEYPENDKIHFYLTLIGSAIEYISYFILSFEQIGKKGIGNNRSPFRVERVRVSGENIYDPAEKKVLRDFPVLKGCDFLPACNDNTPSPQKKESKQKLLQGGKGGGFLEKSPPNIEVSNREGLKLFLESPTRIKFDGRFQKNITFDMIVRNILRRVQLLCTFYCDGPDFVDFTSLIEKSKEIKIVDKKINWQQQMRFSYRQEKNVSMGGVSGWIEFAGDVAEFLPFLKIGEYLHVGKGTGLGLGKIKVM